MKGVEVTRGATLTEVMDKSRLTNYKAQILKKDCIYTLKFPEYITELIKTQ